jgi:hypothetical protein
MPTETPEQVLEEVVEGINTGNLETLMALYEPEAAFATQPGRLASGLGRIAPPTVSELSAAVPE